MPLEIPKSPVQHPHHRASGFSIPGRLPCLLAVVLGLFAHHGSAWRSLTDPSTSLMLTEPDGAITLGARFDVDPGLTDFDPEQRTFTAERLFAVSLSLTVAATSAADNEVEYTLTYQGAAECGSRPVPEVGRTRT